MKRIYDKPRIEKYIEKHQIYQYFDHTGFDILCLPLPKRRISESV